MTFAERVRDALAWLKSDRALRRASAMTDDELRAAGYQLWENADAEVMLTPRRVTNIVAFDGGYDVTFEPCGHKAWFAIWPGVTDVPCAQCVHLVMEAWRRQRRVG